MKKAGLTLEDIRNTPAGRREDNAHLFASTQRPKKKRAKFGNNKVEWEGLVFDSTKEYRRYRELLILLKQGIIGQLERQVTYLLIEGNDTEKPTHYIADHRYIECSTGNIIVEDVKSEATRKLPDYIMKRKLMLDRHGITLKEV